MGFPAPIARSVDRRGDCSHVSGQIELDSEAEIVRCGACKSIISPYFALRRLVRKWDHQAAAVRALDELRGKLELEVAALRKERTSLRAMVKRGKARGEGA